MYRALKDEYGLFAGVCMLMVFPDTVETMASIERHVLQPEDEAALALKASFVTDFNLEAVAVRMIHASRSESISNAGCIRVPSLLKLQ